MMSTENHRTGTTQRAGAGRVPEPVAIVGIGCRFPGAENPSAFWQLLTEGVDAISEIPRERWDADAFYDADARAPGKMNTRWGGLLKEIDKFDVGFFKISPREAPHIDPQQRLLLEVTWEALEDAGQLPEKLAGTRTGVFVGIMGNDYGDAPMNDPQLVNFYTFPGIARCIAANRLSYFFDFQGPSIAVDSACSSSLVAIHLACQSLWNGESTLALAGGVNMILSPEGTIWYAKAGLMAADGRCKTFDARADGLVRGEGAGVVVLKLLSEALADGDRIYAVIKGGAVNQDGRSNGLTAPSKWAQEAVVRAACRQAGISPAEVGYVEAHGTGTALGDPIEMKALGNVLGEGRPEGRHCAVGSVKTNIGHLEAAAGVAGLVKVALMLKHRRLVPSLHFQNPNPHIPFDKLPLRVQQTPAPWPEETAALAGVSSFGFGGTNAHLVLGESPVPAGPVEDERPSPVRPNLLPISARTPEALQTAARVYERYLRSEGAAESLRDICYTAGARRTHHEHRLALVGRSHEELVERLGGFLRDGVSQPVATGRRGRGGRRKLAFVFSGQGPQWWAMGRRLLDDEPVFRAALGQCDELFGRIAGWSLLGELTADEAASRVGETEVAQPTIFAVQVGLAALWRSWGVEPDAVVGHSVGEVAAAHVAGVLSLDDAVRVIFHRGRLMQRATGRGKMAAVKLSPEEASNAIAGYADRLAVAAHNGPRSSVLSGDAEALEEVLGGLRRDGVLCRPLPVNYAFHSPQMKALEAELVAALEGVEARQAALPIIPTSGASAGGGRDFDAPYWGRQVCEPVEFAEAMKRLLADGFQDFVEVGPHPVLTEAITECLREHGQEGTALASLRRREDEREVMLKTAGKLFTLGHKVNLGQAQGAKGRCVPLPPYPWQRERFWLKEQERRNERHLRRVAGKAAGGAETDHPLLGNYMRSAAQTNTHHWETEVSAEASSYLNAHRVQGVVILPAAVCLEMTLAAAGKVFGAGEHALKDVSFDQAIVCGEGRRLKLQLVVARESESEARFHIYSSAQGDDGAVAEWAAHVSGTIRLGGAHADAAQIVSPEEVRRRCAEAVGGEDFYRSLRRRGFEYGTVFQGVRELWRGDGEAIARLRLPEGAGDEAAACGANPLLLDACLQVLAGALPPGAEQDAYVPVGIGRARLFSRPDAGAHTRGWGYAVFKRADDGGRTLEGDVLLLDEQGRAIFEATGFRLQRLRGGVRGAQKADVNSWLYEIGWHTLEGEAAPAEPDARSRGRWLVFADDGGVARSVTARLEGRGEECVVVHASDAYQELSAREFSLRPERPEDFRRLFAELSGHDGRALRGVIHLWNLDAASPQEVTSTSLEAAQVKGCDSVLHLVQALERAGRMEQGRLWLVTSGAQALTDGDAPTAFAQSLVWGLGRVAAQEFPQLRCTLVDLSAAAPTVDVEALVRLMLSATAEEQLALRDGACYAARLRPRRAADDTPSGVPSRTVRADGTYLITGGTGGLGLKVAQWLVGRGARHLVLMSRNDPSAEARESIAAMEREGARAVVMACDVASAEGVAAALSRVEAEMPPLKGVIHAAGVLDDGLLPNLDRERLARVLAPKVYGAWNLHRLTLTSELDFFIFFSSLATTFGAPGQGNYAAANSFLDALAHSRRAAGLPALSINWGPWAGVGMAADREAAFAQRGIRSLSPEQGTRVLEELLGAQTAQAVVLPFEADDALTRARSLAGSRLLAGLFDDFNATAGGAQTQAPDSSVRAPLIARLDGALPGERLGILVAGVEEEARHVLGLSASHRLDTTQGFFDMGMDSLMIAELSANLQTKLGKTFALSAVFEHANVVALANYIAGEVLSLELAAEVAGTPPPEEADVESALAELERLSDEEALALLTQKLPSF